MKLIFTLLAILSVLSACHKTISNDQAKNSDTNIYSESDCQELSNQEKQALADWNKQDNLVRNQRKTIDEIKANGQESNNEEARLKLQEQVLDDLLTKYHNARDKFNNSDCPKSTN
ncbi:MAG: hypothetical protein OXC37_00125 [Bdellovibrionaceae bacterium]|nr:hypothetical protein [Pseudobdellovibrionaceae bacterium]